MGSILMGALVPRSHGEVRIVVKAVVGFQLGDIVQGSAQHARNPGINRAEGEAPAAARLATEVGALSQSQILNPGSDPIAAILAALVPR